MIIERYVEHHVRLHRTWFTIWHPITCDLDVCDVYDRCNTAWPDPPAPLGFYLINDETLELSPPAEKKTYRVIEGNLDMAAASHVLNRILSSEGLAVRFDAEDMEGIVNSAIGITTKGDKSD